MACSRPIEINNPNKVIGGKIKVQCGDCLMCRIAKVQWLVDAGNYEHNKFGTASYITLTYENEALMKLNRLIELENGEILSTCSYKDGIKFIDKLKKHIIYHKLPKPYFNSNFKYLMATEYGDESQRAHIHAILFGIDHIVGEKLMRDKWPYGFVTIKPLLSGGIRYVSDYLMTNYIDKEIYKAYEQEYGIEKPKVKHSNNFGYEMIEKNLEDIIANNGTYKTHNNRRVTIPRYIANKYNILHRPDYRATKELVKEMEIEMKRYEQKGRSKNQIYDIIREEIAKQNEEKMTWKMLGNNKKIDYQRLIEETTPGVTGYELAKKAMEYMEPEIF